MPRRITCWWKVCDLVTDDLRRPANGPRKMSTWQFSHSCVVSCQWGGGRDTLRAEKHKKPRLSGFKAKRKKLRWWMTRVKTNHPVVQQMQLIGSRQACVSIKKLSRKPLSVSFTWSTSCAPPSEVTDYVLKNRKCATVLFAGLSWASRYFWQPGVDLFR